MATALASHEPQILTSQVSAFEAASKDWAINLSIEVNADARRIFQALTVPEYIEAWIVLPNLTSDSKIQATEDADGYRLDHVTAGRKTVSIKSSYLFRHQRKLRMLWEKTRQTDCDASLVDFRLRGNFGSSVLELRHSEIRSLEEYDWHLGLWHNSLGKLASLLQTA
jgi:uncharacterized protein YndB with AHSA1/START domain